MDFEVKQGEGQAKLYNDRHGAGPVLLFDWSRSALSAVFPRNDNTKLTWFKDFLRKAIIVQVDPFAMSTESREEATMLDAQAGNFVSWYRQVSRDQGLTIDIVNRLRSVIDGYQSFKFTEAGEQHRILWVGFADERDRRKEIMYRLDELSHGQRTLVVLYTLIEFFRGQDAGPFLLCLDEPENFVALPELQPWLVALHDYCLDSSLQAILISHHPEFIDYLAAENGVWFERQPNSPVRVRRLEAEEGGIPISELVARGWIDG